MQLRALVDIIFSMPAVQTMFKNNHLNCECKQKLLWGILCIDLEMLYNKYLIFLCIVLSHKPDKKIPIYNSILLQDQES